MPTKSSILMLVIASAWLAACQSVPAIGTGGSDEIEDSPIVDENPQGEEAIDPS